MRLGDHRRRQWHPTLVLLPRKSHGRRNLVGCRPWGREESDMTERLHFHFSLSCIGGGNGNPLQCSCLENPRDGGASWAAVSGVAQSQTRLKRLSSSSSSRRSCHKREHLLWRCPQRKGFAMLVVVYTLLAWVEYNNLGEELWVMRLGKWGFDCTVKNVNLVVGVMEAIDLSREVMIEFIIFLHGHCGWCVEKRWRWTRVGSREIK